jgi:hypothetical protein
MVNGFATRSSMSRKRESKTRADARNEPAYVSEQRRVLLDAIDAVVMICRACRADISKPLLRWPLAKIATDASGEPAISKGFFWVAPTVFESESGVNPGDVVVSLDDQRHVVGSGRRNGCCGVDGLDGFNVSCVCGYEVGIETSDCWTPRMLTLPASAIEIREPRDEEREALPIVVMLRGGSITSRDSLVLAMHDAAAIEAWFGDDLAGLVERWRSEITKDTLVVWRDAGRAREAGVDVSAIERLFAPQIATDRPRLTLLVG